MKTCRGSAFDFDLAAFLAMPYPSCKKAVDRKKPGTRGPISPVHNAFMILG
jgi:hypothetical protein